MKLQIMKAARADLRSISAYIARDNPLRAETYLEELIAKMELIAERPLSFPARNEWQADLRSALHHHYHILFKINGDTVSILRVLHGARNIPDNI